MADWEYATAYISLEHGPSEADVETLDGNTVTINARTQSTLVGTSPSGDRISGLSAVLNAWALAGWELVTMTYQRVEKQIDSSTTPQMPAEVVTTVTADVHIAIFKRPRSA